MDTIMEVFVETAIGTFSIRVNMWDTVLSMKQKIEKSQYIPVSKQILFFDSKILDDNLNIMQCQIFHNSRLQLIIDQLLYQTEESPSERSDQFNESFYPQAWPVMVNDQVLPLTEPPLVTADSVKEFLEYGYLPEMMEDKNNQLLNQNEPFSVPSSSIGETIDVKVQALNDISKIQSEEIIHGKDSPVMVRSMKKESLPLNSSEEFLAIQDLQSVPVGNKNKGLKTEQSPKSDSVKRIINASDLPVRKRRKINPMKLEVMVQPFQETRKIPVFVNANEKVEELRKVLAKMQQMGMLDLPEEGYFFIHKQDVLTDNQTFEENLVSHGDTIEIFRGKVTLGGSVPPRTRTFSH